MHTRNLAARVTERPLHVGVANLSVEPEPAILRSNEIMRARFVSVEPLAFDAYDDNRATGAFIVIDEDTNAIVAAGMIARPESDASPLAERGFDFGPCDPPRLQMSGRSGFAAMLSDTHRR